MSSFLTITKSVKSLPSLRCCGNLLKQNPYLLPIATNRFATKSDSTNDHDWRIIYRMPLITLASAFNRVKVPFSMLNGIIVPAAFALEQSSQLPASSAVLISSVGLTSCCTLAICSYFVQNLIGIIYINANNDKLKLAYIDYWGKRHDVCVELHDVIPEREITMRSKNDFYQTLCLYSDDKVKYILLQRYGKIEDPEAFASIFGD